MTDADSQTGPSVTLDPNGHVLLPYNSIAQVSDGMYLVTPTAGAAFLVPRSQFIGGDPGVQTAAGSVLINESYAKSMSII